MNYMHKIPVKLPTAHTSLVTSVIALISSSSIPSVHRSDDEDQEILAEFPATKYGEKFLIEIMADILMM